MPAWARPEEPMTPVPATPSFRVAAPLLLALVLSLPSFTGTASAAAPAGASGDAPGATAYGAGGPAASEDSDDADDDQPRARRRGRRGRARPARSASAPVRRETRPQVVIQRRQNDALSRFGI